jgi:2'-hydroxyisoflavone reductase
VGPHDYSDRFTYWPYRIAQGGEVLAPGEPERQIQLIDVRDLAEWNIRMVEAGRTGVYNATGPEKLLTMGQILEECKHVCTSDTRFTWVDESFLLEEGATPWSEIPLWISRDAEIPGFLALNIKRALASGLTFRPLSETILDTLAWDSTRSVTQERESGLKPEREARLLQEWHKRNKESSRL